MPPKRKAGHEFNSPRKTRNRPDPNPTGLGSEDVPTFSNILDEFPEIASAPRLLAATRRHVAESGSVGLPVVEVTPPIGHRIEFPGAKDKGAHQARQSRGTAVEIANHENKNISATQPTTRTPRVSTQIVTQTSGLLITPTNRSLSTLTDLGSTPSPPPSFRLENLSDTHLFPMIHGPESTGATTASSAYRKRKQNAPVPIFEHLRDSRWTPPPQDIVSAWQQQIEDGDHGDDEEEYGQTRERDEVGNNRRRASSLSGQNSRSEASTEV